MERCLCKDKVPLHALCSTDGGAAADTPGIHLQAAEQINSPGLGVKGGQASLPAHPLQPQHPHPTATTGMAQVGQGG